MFLVQVRGSHSALSVGLEGALAALRKMDELSEGGKKDVTVLSAQGHELSREQLQMLAATASSPD